MFRKLPFSTPSPNPLPPQTYLHHSPSTHLHLPSTPHRHQNSLSHTYLSSSPFSTPTSSPPFFTLFSRNPQKFPFTQYLSSTPLTDSPLHTYTPALRGRTSLILRTPLGVVLMAPFLPRRRPRCHHEMRERFKFLTGHFTFSFTPRNTVALPPT